MKKSFLYALLITTLLSSPVYGEEVDCVVSSGPCWDSFTNEDGTGLYHEIFRKGFGL